jgi:hypothetical protein
MPANSLTVDEIVAGLTGRFEGLAPKASWGETSLFYNPGAQLANGIYFVTIKEDDGENDKASRLGREGVFRVSFGLAGDAYQRMFGAKPGRPAKGGVVEVGGAFDFAGVGELMPHPIYAWMGWVQILSPSRAGFDALLPLLDDSYAAAKVKFARAVGGRELVGG